MVKKIANTFSAKRVHKKCGSFERYASDGCCVVCSKIKSKNQYKKNKVNKNRNSNLYEKKIAEENKVIKYASTTACSGCKVDNPLRYTSSRSCVSCIKKNSKSKKEYIKKIKGILEKKGYTTYVFSLFEFYCLSRESGKNLDEWVKEQRSWNGILKFTDGITDVIKEVEGVKKTIKKKDILKHLEKMYKSNEENITAISIGKYDQAKFKNRYQNNLRKYGKLRKIKKMEFEDFKETDKGIKLYKWYLELKIIAEEQPFNKRAQIDYIIAKATLLSEQLTKEEEEVYMAIPLTQEYFR